MAALVGMGSLWVRGCTATCTWPLWTGASVSGALEPGPGPAPTRTAGRWIEPAPLLLAKCTVPLLAGGARGLRGCAPWSRSGVPLKLEQGRGWGWSSLSLTIWRVLRSSGGLGLGRGDLPSTPTRSWAACSTSACTCWRAHRHRRNRLPTQEQELSREEGRLPVSLETGWTLAPSL